MDVHASEKEQVEALTSWWKENGISIVTGVLLGLSGLLGFKAWQGYQGKQALNASNIYAQMRLAAAPSAGAGKSEQVRELANELISRHSGSAYAVLAALELAHQAAEKGELAAAQAQLQWALEHADSDAVRHTARLRLLQVLLDRKLYDEADQRLAAVQNPGAFAYQYSEFKGDLAVARGDTKAAAAAYRQALEQLPAAAPNRGLLAAKYENVGGDPGDVR